MTHDINTTESVYILWIQNGFLLRNYLTTVSKQQVLLPKTWDLRRIVSRQRKRSLLLVTEEWEVWLSLVVTLPVRLCKTTYQTFEN